MGISCDCGFEDYEWYYEVEDNERSACAIGKCYGCSGQINIGDEVRRMWEYQYDEFGNEDFKPLGRLCPTCSGLYDSLIELGFCLTAERGFITEAMEIYRNDYTWQ